MGGMNRVPSFIDFQKLAALVKALLPGKTKSDFSHSPSTSSVPWRVCASVSNGPNGGSCAPENRASYSVASCLADTSASLEIALKKAHGINFKKIDQLSTPSHEYDNVCSLGSRFQVPSFGFQVLGFRILKTFAEPDLRCFRSHFSEPLAQGFSIDTANSKVGAIVNNENLELRFYIRFF